MAWNPEPEVAVARDAAKALGDAPICIVIWLTKKGDQINMASYGKTKFLCDFAGAVGHHCLKAATEYGANEE